MTDIGAARGRTGGKLPALRGRRVPRWVAVLALVAGTAAPGALPASAAGQDKTLIITVDGRVRTARVHLPPQKSGILGLPVVLAFHGRLGDGAGMQRLTHLDTVADENGFLVAYPDGYRRSWNDGRADSPANAAGVDDVAFVRALLERLERDYAVDGDRVFATGMSNGGFFTQRLGCELAGTFAAVAPVASVLPKKLAARCGPSRPMPVLMIAGTEDPLVPYGGGTVEGSAGGAAVLSAKASAKRWRVLAGCGAPTSKTLPDKAKDGTSVSLLVAKKCDRGSGVQLYTVTGGGHTWPGGTQYLPAATIGRTSRDFDASATIWAFFRAHAR